MINRTDQIGQRAVSADNNEEGTKRFDRIGIFRSWLEKEVVLECARTIAAIFFWSHPWIGTFFFTISAQTILSKSIEIERVCNIPSSTGLNPSNASNGGQIYRNSRQALNYHLVSKFLSRDIISSLQEYSKELDRCMYIYIYSKEP